MAEKNSTCFIICSKGLEQIKMENNLIYEWKVYDYWLYFRLCILQAPPPLLHGIHCFGMPWLIMQASHLQINKIANLSLHHGILCLHIVCCCSDRYMEAINQCQIQYCGLVVYTLYCNIILRKIVLNLCTLNLF